MRTLRWQWDAEVQHWPSGAEDERLCLLQVELDGGDVTQDALLFEILSSEERARLSAFRFEGDRRRYLRSRGALRLALSRYLNAPPQAIALGRREHGKPFLLDASARLEFNLAHSQGRMLLGVCRSGRIGVDVERLDPSLETRPLGRHVLSNAEAEYVESLPIGERAATFLQFWVVKEALVKATGEGLSRQITELELELPMRSAEPRLLRAPGSSSTSWTISCWWDGDYVAAVAIEAAETA